MQHTATNSTLKISGLRTHKPTRSVIASLNIHKPHAQGSHLGFASHALAHTTSTRRTATSLVTRAQGGDGEKPVNYNTQFGYSRKDVILIGVGLIGIGVVMYYGLQSFFGVDAIMAGNYVQLTIFIGICIGWIGSYLFRVANKDMTYVKQLQDYEDAVMAKRLEEMPDTEVETLMEQIEQEKADRKNRQRFKAVVKALKREILALYYAMDDPALGWVPKVLALLTVAYALSPMDLIPDFIPILGLIDDLIILPGMIWLTIKLIPDTVMSNARRRADTEPLRLSKNWVMGVLFFLMWDVLLAWLVLTTCRHIKTAYPTPNEYAWFIVAGVVGLAAVAEGTWMVLEIRKERRRDAERAAMLEEDLLLADEP